MDNNAVEASNKLASGEVLLFENIRFFKEEEEDEEEKNEGGYIPIASAEKYKKKMSWSL